MILTKGIKSETSMCMNSDATGVKNLQSDLIGMLPIRTWEANEKGNLFSIYDEKASTKVGQCGELLEKIPNCVVRTWCLV